MGGQHLSRLANSEEGCALLWKQVEPVLLGQMAAEAEVPLLSDGVRTRVRAAVPVVATRVFDLHQLATLLLPFARAPHLGATGERRFPLDVICYR